MRTGSLRAPLPLVAAALVALAACSPRAGANEVVTVHVRIHYSSFQPSDMRFSKGTTVRFVIHNTDPIEHEFIIGSPARQLYFERTAHPAHDGSVPGQITVPPGATRRTIYTFGAPTSRSHRLLFACHLPGHFAYGMRGPIVVVA